MLIHFSILICFLRHGAKTEYMIDCAFSILYPCCNCIDEMYAITVVYYLVCNSTNHEYAVGGLVYC